MEGPVELPLTIVSIGTIPHGQLYNKMSDFMLSSSRVSDCYYLVSWKAGSVLVLAEATNKLRLLQQKCFPIRRVEVHFG
jgi:hypothetical protein